MPDGEPEAAVPTGTGDDTGEKVLSHELDATERTASHRLVAAAMLTTFLVIFISQGWWKKIQDFVIVKTHGTPPVTKPGG